MKQIKKTSLSVSWFAFTLLSAIVITMLNYRAFEYVYNNLSSSNFLALYCLWWLIFVWYILFLPCFL